MKSNEGSRAEKYLREAKLLRGADAGQQRTALSAEQARGKKAVREGEKKTWGRDR